LKSIVKIQHGFFDYASIKYRDEEAILASQPDPEAHSINVILPDKLRLAKHYAEEVWFRTDVSIMGETLKSIVVREIVDLGIEGL
jgi:hypothetical protein